jgi:hypothetical protein
MLPNALAIKNTATNIITIATLVTTLFTNVESIFSLLAKWNEIGIKEYNNPKP